MVYDVLVIGSGPGGYAAAIRAAQLGLNTAIVERAELGGTCLNWGCIPTKALLKSAEVYRYASHAADYGVSITEITPDLPRMVERSRSVAGQMSKGIDFLMKKNGIRVIAGSGSLTTIPGQVQVVVEDHGAVELLEVKHIILATGARPRELPSIPVDGIQVITSHHALTLSELPKTMVVVGSGAIGLEFALFYHSIGVQVTVVENAPRLAPLEDGEISKLLERSFRKAKIATLLDTEVRSVTVENNRCRVVVHSEKKGEETLEAEKVLSAVGIIANIENIGLEEAGVNTERGKIIVDEHYRTSAAGIYAIGDIIPTPALAHVATAEAIHCAEYIAGLNPTPVNYGAIPSCIYTTPEMSGVGLTEEQAIEKGYALRIGRFPFTASGRATASGNRDGLVKLIFDAQTDKLLGAHFFGGNVTELIGEATLAMHLGATAKDILHTIHAHPTLSEALMEAAAEAHGEAIHL